MIDEDKLSELVGLSIRDKRLNRSPKMTQVELADLLQISRTSLTLIETGKQRLTLAQLLSLSEILSVPLERILPPIQQVSVPNDRTINLGPKEFVVPEKTAEFLNNLPDQH